MNGGVNYVAKGLQFFKKPVVFKVIPCQRAYMCEKKALLTLKEYPMVILLNFSDDAHALLLEKITPGFSLKGTCTHTTEEKIKIYGTLLKDFPQEMPEIQAYPAPIKNLFEEGEILKGGFVRNVPHFIVKKIPLYKDCPFCLLVYGRWLVFRKQFNPHTPRA